jgi:anti-sigma regulatory factor (Ser/Thr protein kinase)
MEEAARNRDQLEYGTARRVSTAYEGMPGDAAHGRQVARDFLTSVQAVHGFPVSDRAMETVQLVVSELLTNAFRHAPGPCLLDLELLGGRVRITVWDNSSALPTPSPRDPARVGQHGLEIVMAVSQSFEVHREPLGKRMVAAVMLADDPDGDIAGHRP